MLGGLINWSKSARLFCTDGKENTDAKTKVQQNRMASKPQGVVK